MICQAGKCLKCGVPISKNNRYSNAYTEIHYRMNDGNVFVIGFCPKCELLPEEFEEAMECLREHWDISGFKAPSDWNIVEFIKRRTPYDILFSSQGGRCVKCHERIDGSWAVSNNELIHEICEEKRVWVS